MYISCLEARLVFGSAGRCLGAFDIPCNKCLVDRFGDKWSLLVLYNLHTGGRLRFSEIHRRMTDISQKMLASTLRRLEQDGLLSRTVYPEVPPRVEYALTPRGESLMPHLVSLIGWALENFDAIVSDRNSLQATGPDL